MMNERFSELLSRLRRKAKLTNVQLAQLAKVSRSLIPGLQSGKRRIGEYQARKLGMALGLEGRELEGFIFAAINGCTEKVLQESLAYPAELLNLLARQLRLAGIQPDQVRGCVVEEGTEESEAEIFLKDGRQVRLETRLALAA
jgi:transcriptional regulator with XRE-family HTH domain